MQKKPIFSLSRNLAAALLCLLLAFGCQKETSLEKGGFGGTATGELVDSLGNCKNPTVVGNYVVDTPLVPSSNYIVISVNFTSSGRYKIYSDTTNGMWFIDSGFVVSTGATTIKLKGYGTPILPKTTDFALMFGNTLCSFSVNVTGTASTGSTGTSGDFFPTTTGSSWAYKYNPALGSLTNFNVTVAPGQVSVGSLSYARFGTNSLDTFYFAKDGAGNYYAYSSVDFDYTLAFDSLPNYFLSYPFLKENANVGDTWSTDAYGPVYVGSQQGMAKAVFTIISKGGNHTVTGGGSSGQLYSNVIDVQRDIMFEPTGSSTYSLLLRGDSYYAKNYGLVDQIIQTSNTQYVSTTAIPVIK